MTELIEGSRFANSALSTSGANQALPRHRWYSLKEGFSEALVREAISSCRSGGHQLRILDPFCGSGTALVTAGGMGLSATGIEVNPFLAFASRAKCVRGGWDLSRFRACVQLVAEAGRRGRPSPLETFSTFTERPGAEKWLFNRSVLRSFTSMMVSLDESHPFQEPLRLALLASAMACSNVKRDGKGLRYWRDWEARRPGGKDLRARFVRSADEMGSDGSDASFGWRGMSVIEGDARREVRRLPPESFDLLMTSPPYLNSLDYCDVYRPELFLGGFVSSNRELRDVRLRTVRSHVQVGWEPSDVVASPLLERPLGELAKAKLWNARIPAMVQSYFADMAQVLAGCARLVRRSGQAWIVVSTSAYGGVTIPVDLILADIGTRNGWQLQGVYVLRHLRSSGQQWAALARGKTPPLRESLIILTR